MTVVKICGITNLADARGAIAAGADMLGFNFYGRSPRFVEPQKAQEIIARLRTELNADASSVKIAGVFVDEPSVESLLCIAHATGLDAVQLHGEESVEFCRKLKEHAPDLLIIKVLRASDGFQPEDAARYETEAIMLDAFHPDLRGGTGQVVDWTVGRRTRALVPRLFLAGGLSPENVSEAIAQVQPYAVDVCSSIEWAPGLKNGERVRAFISAVRSS